MVRRNELDRRVAQRARELLGPAGAVLLVGARSGQMHTVSAVDEVGEAPARVHDALVWRAPADPLALGLGLRALRDKLAPGAPVLLAIRKRPTVLSRVRGMLGQPAPRPVRLDALCGALLASGLLLPRVHDGVPSSWYLLSARLPEAPCSLDRFFAQLTPA